MRIDEIHPPGWRPALAGQIRSGAAAASVSRGSISPALVARWLLLCAVLAGVFLLHVLTAENNHSAHGTIASPAITAADLSASPSAPDIEAPAVLPVVSDAVTPSGVTPAGVTPAGDRDGADMAGCILFLVVTAASVGLLILQRARAHEPPPAGALLAITRRGPPASMMPRLSLGVIRV